MRRNPNRAKVCALIKALRHEDYRPADLLASICETDKPFVYAWCREFRSAGLVDVKTQLNHTGRGVYMWRWKSE